MEWSGWVGGWSEINKMRIEEVEVEVEEDEESIIMTTGSASTSMTTVNKKDDDDRPEPEACRYCKHKGEMLVEF